MSFLEVDFSVQRTVTVRGEVFDAFGDRRFGSMGESYAILGQGMGGGVRKRPFAYKI